MFFLIWKGILEQNDFQNGDIYSSRGLIVAHKFLSRVTAWSRDSWHFFYKYVLDTFSSKKSVSYFSHYKHLVVSFHAVDHSTGSWQCCSIFILKVKQPA